MVGQTIYSPFSPKVYYNRTANCLWKKGPEFAISGFKNPSFDPELIPLSVFKISDIHFSPIFYQYRVANSRRKKPCILDQRVVKLPDNPERIQFLVCQTFYNYLSLVFHQYKVANRRKKIKPRIRVQQVQKPIIDPEQIQFFGFSNFLQPFSSYLLSLQGCQRCRSKRIVESYSVGPKTPW